MYGLQVRTGRFVIVYHSIIKCLDKRLDGGNGSSQVVRHVRESVHDAFSPSILAFVSSRASCSSLLARIGQAVVLHVDLGDFT